MAAPMAASCDEKLKSKMTVCVDDLRPGTEGNICVCDGEKRHQICAIHTGTEHVYIYENETRKAVYRLPSQCQCMCVLRDASGNEHLVCGTRDGRVIHQSLEHFRDQSRAKKKKKKKEKHKSNENQRASDPESKECENNIFGELLNAETRPSSFEVPPDLGTDDVFEDVITLGDADALLTEPNLQDLLWVGGSLVTCAKCATGYSISVYRREAVGKSQVGCASTSHNPHGGRGLGFEKSPSFRTFLPKGGMESPSRRGARPHHQSGVSQHMRHSKETEAEGLIGESRKPRLFFAVSQSMSGKEAPSTVSPERGLILEDGLYNQLFGVDSNFLDAPVILVCLPDGRIYYIPVRSQGGSQSTEFKPARTSSSLFGLNTYLFYVLDQPVATIHGFSTGDPEAGQTTGNGHHTCDCVCIVGQYGRIVQITVNGTTNQKETLRFTESLIKSPVQATCKTKTPLRLLYSTGREIYAASFSKSSGESTASAERSSVSASFVLGIGNIRALAVVGRAGRDTSGSYPIMALTTTGKVLKLHPPAAGSHGDRRPPITAPADGKRMQGLLRAIGNLSTRSSELAELSETNDQILREMSQACHVAGSLLGDHASGRNSAIFGAEVQTAFRNDGAVCRLELVLRLTNHSLWTLSHGWSLLVSVNAAIDGDTRHHLAKSVPLVNFRPDHTMEVILPLHCGKEPLGLPVEIQSHLFFSPKECIQAFLPGKSDSNSQSHCELGECGISLPLTQPIVLDLLMVLRPAQDNSNVAQGARPVSQYQTSTNRDCDWLASALLYAADARAPSNRTSCLKSRRKSEESASLGLNIGGDIISALIWEHRNNEAVVHVPKCNGPKQIMKRLFGDNTFVKELTNPLRLVTPEAKVVAFEVKGHSPTSHRERGGPSGTGESKEERVEIVITAPAYRTLCQLQLAVDRRVKTVLESEGKARGITTNKDWLQRELKKVQTLQRKLHLLQDAAMQGHPSRSHSNSDIAATLKLHQQMRSQLTFM